MGPEFSAKVSVKPSRYYLQIASFYNNFALRLLSDLAARRRHSMSIGSVGSIGTGPSAQSIRIRTSGSGADTAEIRKQLTTPSKPAAPREGGDTDGNAVKSSSSKASNSSSTASSETADYSSMAKVDLMQLALKGDRDAKKELEKRESSLTGQTGTDVRARIDIVA